MAEAINNCPFCGLSFKSLGHHIYRCKLREGREYRQYLKTGRKTGSDHLALADQSGCAERSQQIQHCGLAKPARPLTSSTPQLIKVEPLTLPDPDDRDAWEATNTFFSSHLVPHLMSLDDPDVINGELTSGIYSYFSKTYGLQPSRTPKAVRRRKKHDRRVRKLREVKNAIRRDYRKEKTRQPPRPRSRLIRQPPISKMSSPSQAVSHLKLQSGFQPPSVQELSSPLARSQWMKLLQESRGADSHPSHAHLIRCHITFSKGVHHCFQPSTTSTIKSGTPRSSQHPGNMQR